MNIYTDIDYARILLQEWQESVSALLARYPRGHVDDLMPDIALEFLDSNLLDVKGATDDEIFAAEQRIGIKLPRDYAAFLRCSNRLLAFGLGGPDDRFLAVHELDLYRKLYPESYNIYIGDYRRNLQQHPELLRRKQVAVYGPEQLPELVCLGHLPECIAISTLDGSATYLLNPNVRDGDYHEAWVLDYRLPGALRFPSFFALIEYEIVRSVSGLEDALR